MRKGAQSSGVTCRVWQLVRAFSALVSRDGFRAAWEVFRERIYRRSASLFFRCATLPGAVVSPPELTIEVIDSTSAKSLRSDLMEAGAGDDFRLFERGAVCYLARWSGLPAGAGWCFRESYLLRRARCGKSARYLAAFQVAEVFRGRGIYTHLLRRMLADVFAQKGVAYIDTTSDNLASRRGIEKAGFTCLGTLHTTLLLGVIIRCRLVPVSTRSQIGATSKKRTRHLTRLRSM